MIGKMKRRRGKGRRNRKEERTGKEKGKNVFWYKVYFLWFLFLMRKRKRGRMYFDTKSFVYGFLFLMRLVDKLIF